MSRERKGEREGRKGRRKSRGRREGGIYVSVSRERKGEREGSEEEYIGGREGATHMYIP